MEDRHDRPLGCTLVRLLPIPSLPPVAAANVASTSSLLLGDLDVMQ